MIRLILLSFTFLLGINSLSAQKFAAASKGIFSDKDKVNVMTTDSAYATYTFNVEAAKDVEDAEVFYLLDKDGKEVELFPEDIIYIDIARGDETAWFKENVEEINEEDLDEEEAVEIYDVYETTKSTRTLVYEQVEIDNKQGSPFKGSNKSDSYLLQLVNDSITDFVKVYISPNFDEGGTEVAPLGQLTETLARNRDDYIEHETFYFVKVGKEPAIRISAKDYLEYAPYIYNKSREFRKKYKIPKDMSKEATKKRKKSSRKDVGKKKKKASPLRFDEFAKHVKEFQALYVVEEAARQKKIADRLAAKKAAKAAKSN